MKSIPHSRLATSPISSRTLRAFSLVELLTVVGIMALILGMSAPGLVSMKSSMDLRSGGMKVTNYLEVARQEARTRNVPAEIRIYEPNSGGYREMQVFLLDEKTDEWKAWAAKLVLPDNVEITANLTYSTLLDASAVATDTDPQTNSQRTYRFFRFLPDGATNLASGYPTLTVMLDRDAGPELPANYIVIQLDSQSGQIKVYQPS